MKFIHLRNSIIRILLSIMETHSSIILQVGEEFMRFLKNITLACLFVITIMTTMPVKADQVIIDTDHLNVRSGPGTHFEKVNQVHTDETYPIIQIQDDWVEIEIGGGSGWITTEYVTIEQEAEVDDSDTEENENQTADTEKNEKISITISHDNTHVRSGPSVDHDIIMFAEQGTQYEATVEKNDWYKIKIEDDIGYIYKGLIDQDQSDRSNHLQGKTIVIDAGHGGRDVGAIGISEVYEKSLTMKTTAELTHTLTTLGANVLLTRSNDEFIRLGSRPLLSNLSQADAFLSIHYNSFTDLTSVDGIDTYYYHDHDKEFASLIQNELIQGTNDQDRGIHYGDFQVIRQNHQPSLLLELGFISNPEKEKLLLTNGYQKKLVKGITTGLEKYFTK